MNQEHPTSLDVPDQNHVVQQYEQGHDDHDTGSYVHRLDAVERG